MLYLYKTYLLKKFKLVLPMLKCCKNCTCSLRESPGSSRLRDPDATQKFKNPSSLNRTEQGTREDNSFFNFNLT